ncbi:MAG: c-type cytochrome biogenesis protein CcmI [Hydrogenophilus sp.]|nr:c-type cytochrome biogenesis protein CcmI [Hydrogenophilus sp.]
MTIWAIGAAAMVVGALLFVLWPLWQRGERGGRVTENAENEKEAAVAALRAERAQLEEARARGEIEEEEYQAALDELRRRVLVEVGRREKGGKGGEERPSPGRGVIWGLGGTAVAVAAGLYLQVGAPQWADPKQIAAAAEAARAGEKEKGDLRGLVIQLRDRLVREGGEPAAWRLLARSYMMLQEVALVEEAWRLVEARLPADPETLLDWAELLAAARGGFDAESRRLIEEAVARDPELPRALALAGAAAAAAEEPAVAIGYWERLLPYTAGNEEARRAVESAIATEREKIEGKQESRALRR